MHIHVCEYVHAPMHMQVLHKCLFVCMYVLYMCVHMYVLCKSVYVVDAYRYMHMCVYT